MLNYQFDILTYQRDAIIMFDTLNSIKDEIQSVDKKFENDIFMIHSKLHDFIRHKSAQISNQNQVAHGDQKMLNDSLFSQKENSVNDNVSLKIHDEEKI